MHKVLTFIKKEGYTRLEYLFLNYYWVITFGGLFYLATGFVILDNTLIPLLIYPLILSGKKQNHSILDTLWWICFLWVPITWMFNSYNNQGSLIFYCLSEQLTYMLSYWVARKHSRLNVGNIMQASYIPLLVTACLGILFMFYEPSWYASKTTDYVTDFEEFQSKRLRSIFSDGYIILYYCGIMMIYELFVVAKGLHKQYIEQSRNLLLKILPKNSSMHIILIVVCFVALLLGMQRAAIVATIGAAFMSLYYAYKYSSLKNCRSIIAGFGLIIAFSIGTIGYLGETQAEYYTATVMNMVDGASDLAKERLTHNKESKEYDLFGDGVGRHNMYAEKFNPGTTMRDGEYNKTLTEQGYIGLFLLGLFLIVAIIKSWYNYKYLGFELAMLAFLTICMIGANTLSAYDKHPILFWMIFGQIANFDRRRQVCCG